MIELFRALAVLVEPPRAETARVAEALGLGPPPTAGEHTELFAFQLHPYASVYLGAEGMLGGEARDRVSGFLAAIGLKTTTPEPDHLSTLLALYARLAELEEASSDDARRESWRGARKAFLWEHVLSWLPCFLLKLRAVAPPFYRAWGELLFEALAAEAETLGPLERLPLHLREAASPVDPRADGADAFLGSLVAPVRSGFILTRSDLSRAARALNLGTRAGERKFMLRALFEQDAGGIVAWLAREAEAWCGLCSESRASFGDVAAWWEERSRSTAALLAELGSEI